MNLRLVYNAANRNAQPSPSSRTIPTTNLKRGDIIRFRGKTPKQDRDYVVINLIGTHDPKFYNVAALTHCSNFRDSLTNITRNNRPFTILTKNDIPQKSVEVVGHVNLERILTSQNTPQNAHS